MLILPRPLPISFNRKFHLAGPVGEHGSVMLRSGRSGYHAGVRLKYDSVVDVLFRNISLLALTESYFPLQIENGSPEQLEELEHFVNWRSDAQDGKLYVLRGDESLGYVVASSVAWIDDPNGSTDDSSVLLAGIDKTRGLEVFSA